MSPNEATQLEPDFQSETTPEAPVGDAAPSGLPAEPAPPELTDLDSVEKFKFAGREWDSKEFRNQYLSNLEAKTEAERYKQEEKYWQNLAYDLEDLKKDPSLLSKFKQIYPEKFHSYVKSFENRIQAPNQQGNYDPKMIERLNMLEQDFQERRQMAAESQLDSTVTKYKSKYEYANEAAVMNNADVLLTYKRSKEGSRAQITDQEWDQMFKKSQDESIALAKRYYTSRVSNQKQANSKGRDVAPGGGTPTSAPVQARTIKEATRLALQEMD